MFECFFAKHVWEAFGLLNYAQIFSNETVVDMFKRLFRNETMEQNVLVALFCWSMWNRWNKWVREKVDMSIFGTRTTTSNLLTDWKKAQIDGAQHKSVVNSSNKHWQLLQMRWVKVNIDVAIFADVNDAGIESVVRGWKGQIYVSYVQQVKVLRSSREAEAISLKEALSWTKRHWYATCVFETDSKLLADAYNENGVKFYLHSFVRDCVNWLSTLIK